MPLRTLRNRSSRSSPLGAGGAKADDLAAVASARPCKSESSDVGCAWRRAPRLTSQAPRDPSLWLRIATTRTSD
eukprot:8846130-Heterocapsa_arctica.AAC.1